MTSAPAQHLYHPLSAHYRRLFGCRVYKISVSVAPTCPNRESPRLSVCTFCDAWGSAADETQADFPLREQIRRGRERIRKRYNADKFLVYFQAYTNTFDRVAHLERLYTEALAEDDVVGVVVGTRPDCLPSRVVGMLDELASEHYVSVELGLQTLDDEQLRFLSRGHDRARSLRALQTLRARPRIDVCAHLMFGIPGETDAQLAETARLLSDAGVQGVKLHNLHVLRGTGLHALYDMGRFTPVTREDYARKVALFLSHLSPEIAVHRLAAVASRWDELVAPDWTRHKMANTQFIEDWMGRHGVRQGMHRATEDAVASAHGGTGEFAWA